MGVDGSDMPAGRGVPTGHDAYDLEGTVSWREVLAETVVRMEAAGLRSMEASWIVEEASGLDPGDDLAVLATERTMAHHDAMVERRLAGEPLQYVLGRWGFRTLDLLVDRRVLIPRPETEVVAGIALLEADRISMERHDDPVLVADLGTGSGAIGLSIAAECPSALVWCTDSSADALAVARANCTGLGRPAGRVTILEGSWFDALPPSMAGTFDVIVSNPPYVNPSDQLPPEVVGWEPSEALFAPDSGRADLEVLVDGARPWLAPGGVLVLEMSPDQTTAMADRARRAGFVDVVVHEDLAGRERAVVARVPT